MKARKTTENLDCGINVAMRVFGAKWKPCIIDAINRGYVRPSEMHREIRSATPRVLDMQLRELEDSGVVGKVVSAGFPLRAEYFITPLGLTILPILAAMNEWGMEHIDTVKKSNAETDIAISFAG